MSTTEVTLIKVTFYTGFHPWAKVLRKDLSASKSWRNPSEEPKVRHVKGPRKTKCFAIWDRLNEGMSSEWSICTKVTKDYEEDAGT